MSPKRAYLILGLCESKKGTNPSKELVWEEIQRINRSHGFISSLEKMDKQELDIHFRKIGDSSKLWRLWELRYSRMDRYSEIKLLREIKDLDPCWFKKALVSINSLAASVILIENHNEKETTANGQVCSMINDILVRYGVCSKEEMEQSEISDRQNKIEDIRRYIFDIDTSECLHEFADSFNWDDDIEYLKAVIQHEKCEKATAKLIY